MTTKKNKEWSGERLETFILGRDAVDHLHRYAMVQKHIRGKKVLDIACGEGYGSNFMSNDASEVNGVDIDAETVKKASAKYKKQNLSFHIGSADAVPFPDASMDVVVSFETIEHHDKHEEMLSEIKRVLKPGGLLIISTPDKLFYSDKRNFSNKFHVKELYKTEFLDLVSRHFKNVQLLNQRHLNGNSIIQDDSHEVNFEIFRGDFSEWHAHEIDPLYLITISSDADFEKQAISIFDGTIVIRESIQQMVEHMQQSRTYRLGKFFLGPIKFFQKNRK